MTSEELAARLSAHERFTPGNGEAWIDSDGRISLCLEESETFWMLAPESDAEPWSARSVRQIYSLCLDAPSTFGVLYIELCQLTRGTVGVRRLQSGKFVSDVGPLVFSARDTPGEALAVALLALWNSQQQNNEEG